MKLRLPHVGPCTLFAAAFRRRHCNVVTLSCVCELADAPVILLYPAQLKQIEF